jgi:hypothetical protein
MEACPNLLDVDALVQKFLQEHASGIATMHRIYFHSNDQLSIRSLTAELTDELRTGCVSFINKNETMDGLHPYLFYITNAYCKKTAIPQNKKKTEYVCPGCLFQNKEVIINYANNYFKCIECEAELKTTSDPKKILFYRVFFKHSKLGYHCADCDRFIPHPVDDSPTISCPYFDCCFVGSWGDLKRMYHPTIRSNPEKIILDAAPEGGSSMKNILVSHEDDALSKLEIKEELENKVKLLREVIDYQSNNVPYSSSDFTVKHKLLVYKAFDNLLQNHPDDMVDYLLNQSRSGGFQHRIFQEYIRLLELSLPYNIKKGNKLHKVESLLDDSLCLFNGISVFTAIVSDKLEIKNNTQEFYIGGRKATYTRPFYIGKLLGITDNKNTQLIQQVSEYSFSKIKVKNIRPGTEVVVTHLRIPPHYQMGGMVYVNRVRKKIVDRAHYMLGKNSDE